MTRSLDESLALFEKIRDFFLDEQKREFVIEISDAPMSEWKINLVYSVDEMIFIRSRLFNRQIDFVGFCCFEEEYHFYYVDKNMFKVQNIDNGNIVDFSDYTRPTYNLKLLLKELEELQAS